MENKRNKINPVLENNVLKKIEIDEQIKLRKKPQDIVQKRLDVCLRAIEHSKKIILELDARASVLRQILGQNNNASHFSLCPTCEMLFSHKMRICSNCGFIAKKFDLDNKTRCAADF